MPSVPRLSEFMEFIFFRLCIRLKELYFAPVFQSVVLSCGFAPWCAWSQLVPQEPIVSPFYCFPPLLHLWGEILARPFSPPLLFRPRPRFGSPSLVLVPPALRGDAPRRWPALPPPSQASAPVRRGPLWWPPFARCLARASAEGPPPHMALWDDFLAKLRGSKYTCDDIAGRPVDGTPSPQAPPLEDIPSIQRRDVFCPTPALG